MFMVFKRNDIKLDFCQCCRWFLRKVYSCCDMIGYNALGNLNIRIHRDITGEIGFGVDIKKHLHSSVGEECRCLYYGTMLVNNYFY